MTGNREGHSKLREQGEEHKGEAMRHPLRPNVCVCVHVRACVHAHTRGGIWELMWEISLESYLGLEWTLFYRTVFFKRQINYT